MAGELGSGKVGASEQRGVKRFERFRVHPWSCLRLGSGAINVQRTYNIVQQSYDIRTTCVQHTYNMPINVPKSVQGSKNNFLHIIKKTYRGTADCSESVGVEFLGQTKQSRECCTYVVRMLYVCCTTVVRCCTYVVR